MTDKTQPQRILVIEDEPDLREGLVHNLGLDGFSVDTASDGRAGLEAACGGAYSLVLLDLMLPQLSGLEVLRRMRADGVLTPVIILSAKGQDADKVAGLELGADDYVTKPFGLAELEARIRAVLRRTAVPAATAAGGGEPGPGARALWEYPGLVVDLRRFTVRRGDREHQLSRYEAEILRMLIRRAGEVVTRADLLTEVWGYVHLPTTRTVDNHIARLRKKLEDDPENPRWVVTVHGIGYRFEGQPQGDQA